MSDIRRYCLDVARRAKRAAAELALVSGGRKRQWLDRCARLLVERTTALCEANQQDVAAAPEYGLSEAAIDRLRLTPQRIGDMAKALGEIAALPEPIGEIISSSIRPNGLEVQKVRVPLGVIFFIYESRPNVTADAAALCVKAGNAVILRGGKEAIHSNTAIAAILAEAAAAAGLPADAVQLVATTDRAAVGCLLRMPEYIDLCIPRGGESLIRRVSEEARMPVIKHFAGNCHVYLDESADAEMAERIVVNAKCQRMGVCNAAESLVVHAAAADASAARRPALLERGVEIRGDERTRQLLFAAKPASDEDFADRVSRPDHLLQGRRFVGRGDRAHQPLQFAAHRGDCDPRSGGGAAVCSLHRQFGGDDQRQHAAERRRRVRAGGRDRHQHRQVSRPRAVRCQ